MNTAQLIYLNTQSVQDAIDGVWALHDEIAELPGWRFLKRRKLRKQSAALGGYADALLAENQRLLGQLRREERMAL